MTNYSWRVTDLDLASRSVANEGAVDVGPIVTNEFGERQFWFCAPDGYEWLLLEDKRA